MNENAVFLVRVFPLFHKEISDSKLLKTVIVAEAVFHKFKRSILNWRSVKDFGMTKEGKIPV